MSALLNVVERNVHEVRVDDERLMFHVPSSSLFAADRVTADIIDALRASSCTADELFARLAGRSPRGELAETLGELMALEVVSDGSPLTPEIAVKRVERTAIDTVVLNVNTGCNLSCTYCYKEDLDTPSAGRRMDIDTAKASVEMLLKESPDLPRYTVVFFGGEPLSNRKLIECMVEYCELRFGALGKQVEFVMTTNATLLTEEIVDWLDAHRFGLSVSIDGPRSIHDLNRRTVGGAGTYDVVRRKVEMLLKRYRSRPVGARVTLTSGVTDIEGIWDHLFNELGFAEVGFAPVTSGQLDTFNLKPDELARVFANMKALGRRYLDAALESRNIGFSNLHQLITDLHEGHKKSLPCGAGLKMLAVDHKGDLNLCHRFTGSTLPTFGNVHEGVAQAELNDFLSQRLERSGTGCETCRIRNLCSGGCYHESYARYGDPTHPTYHYCELMRDWIDFGIEIYSRIIAGNPAFIGNHITPRKAN
ncbi:quinohemoprotein amine dehydrogenase maturation protein [Burkholderia diffusa]|uniref:Quinohemoprotein amine dehydrogenase maturation protein n=1 Tax=Burkholderia diffusa TaxID=488732 RepID=A0AAW3PMR7_9BURK|nr:quinohemoprotein amine dehydrogenase maturation protein [Burkholderia diffusa]KVC16229.1 quinohemoprotein amine dehydrogenase maturation protein [Burkholderia diffusa]KVG26543.1 quinohemoprotein amine dehydrogenase maturation protein [Burkholderia diffusa]KVH45332.1 quinohemoprotein amine dehydrogenase maturation protein [Burkholderia diffusa]KWF39567.1 quinohemoprotein amine dehydrogenase maturation protein [Burkholderia diffusa]KWF40783.1 quinohemoprotein amine dehydrogenase maturation pr